VLFVESSAVVEGVNEMSIIVFPTFNHDVPSELVHTALRRLCIIDVYQVIIPMYYITCSFRILYNTYRTQRTVIGWKGDACLHGQAKVTVQPVQEAIKYDF
jgi:hypothetical protein